MGNFLTIKQASTILGISRQRVHVLVKQKRIKAQKVKKGDLIYWEIESKELERFRRER